MTKRAGFVGLRLAAAASGASLLGIGLALLAWQGLAPERGRALSELTDALEARRSAGVNALGALDRAQATVDEARAARAAARREAAERRASELVLLHARGSVPAGFAPRAGERVGRISLPEDRLALARTATATAPEPESVAGELRAALEAAPAAVSGPLLVRAGPGIYAALRADGEGVWDAAFVPLPPRPSTGRDFAAARGAIGNLAEPAPVPGPIARPELALGLAGLLGALLVFVWARVRVSGPLLETLDAARDFVHGDPGARADEQRGGREAREVARAVNGLVERAARLETQGRAAREEDIQAAALAIEALGKGDLRQVTPRLAPPFGPLSRALDRARRDLLARVERLHEVCRAVALDAAAIAPGARNWASATGGQREALERLSQGLSEAERQVGDGQARLSTALDGLSAAAAEQRRVTQDLKATSSLVGRRLVDIGASAARVQRAAAGAKAVEQGLSMLATWAASGGPSSGDTGRATQLVGEGRAALAGLAEELSSVQDELTRAAESLETVGGSELTAPPDPARTAAGPLFESANGLLRASELLAQGLSGWVRTVRKLGQDTEAVADAADAASGRLATLSEALSELRVGDAFETVLLERLERARAEIEAAGEAELTLDGEAMVAEVEAAANAARARVGQLIQATEATLDVLRR